MFVLLVAACFRHSEPEPPKDWSQTSRDALIAACEARELGACGALARDLERGGDPAAGLDLGLFACREDDELACYAAALIARSAPPNASPAVVQELDERLCGYGLSYACMRRAEVSETNLWWEKACENEDYFACALNEGSYPSVAEDLFLSPTFAEALDKAGLEFTPPPGFITVEPTPNPDFAWDFGIRARDGSVELRYQVNDLETFKADKAACDAKPGCVYADPNAIGTALAFVSALNVAVGEPSGPQELPSPAVQYEFNADWGQLFVFSPRPTFATGWENGLLIALHRQDLGDARVVMLVNGDLGPAWYAAFHALRFRDEHHP